MAIKSIEQQPIATTLQKLIPGRIILPTDAYYETARKVWNGAADQYPAMIAYCESATDVQAALRTARDYGLPISVRSAGYDGEGRSVKTGGLVIDITQMNQVEVNGRIATVAGGAPASAVISTATAHDLIVVTGWNGIVGMAGLTLAGGYGPLIARHGLALDSLVGAELILANGDHVVADANENSELLWALKGGGGNFGVVTALKLGLHSYRLILGGMILFPWLDAEKVLSGYGAIAAGAGNDLTVLAGMFCLPDGHRTLFLAPVWSGEPTQGKNVMESLQGLGTPFHTQIDAMTYQDLTRSFDARVVHGRHYAMQTRWIPSLLPEVISAFIEAGNNLSSPLSTIILQHFRGKPTEIRQEATAFGLRQEHFLVEIIAAWEPVPEDDGSNHRAWARNLSNMLAPSALPGGYPVMLNTDDRDQIAYAYGGNLSRLRAVKHRIDPDARFSSTPLTE